MSLWEQLKPHAWEIGAALVGGLIGAAVAVAVLLFLAWCAVGAP